MDLLNDQLIYPAAKKTYTLKSSDGQTFQIDIKSLERSRLASELLKSFQDETEIPLPEVEGKTLKRIVEYLLHYKERQPRDIPKPLRDPKLDKVLDKWDYDFIIGVSMPDCIDLINAANYMEIDSLLRLSCARLAARMIELPLEDVQKTFGIECDMSEEEASQFDKYNLTSKN